MFTVLSPSLPLSNFVYRCFLLPGSDKGGGRDKCALYLLARRSRLAAKLLRAGKEKE